jgi:hypothetical protein
VRGCEKILIGLSKCLYKSTKARVKVRIQVTEGSHLQNAKRWNLASNLPELYLQVTLLQNWTKKCGRVGVVTKDENIFSLCFTDDQVIVTKIKTMLPV